MEKSNTSGFFIAVDGPDGAGKSTLIQAIKTTMETRGFSIYTTREPTNTEFGNFVKQYAENHSGISLACLVAADRYEHIRNEIIPELNKGKAVITDRYVLSSLIFQGIDDVSDSFILSLNSEIIKPDLQLAVFANEDILQKRLEERKELTRFEKGNQSNSELFFMSKGIAELEKIGVDVLSINNDGNLENNVEKIISYIINNWRPMK